MWRVSELICMYTNREARCKLYYYTCVLYTHGTVYLSISIYRGIINENRTRSWIPFSLSSQHVIKHEFHRELSCFSLRASQLCLHLSNTPPTHREQELPFSSLLQTSLSSLSNTKTSKLFDISFLSYPHGEERETDLVTQISSCCLWVLIKSSRRQTDRPKATEIGTTSRRRPTRYHHRWKIFSRHPSTASLWSPSSELQFCSPPPARSFADLPWAGPSPSHQPANAAPLSEISCHPWHPITATGKRLAGNVCPLWYGWSCVMVAGAWTLRSSTVTAREEQKKKKSKEEKVKKKKWQVGDKRKKNFIYTWLNIRCTPLFFIEIVVSQRLSRSKD